MKFFLAKFFLVILFGFNLFADTDLYPTDTATDITGQYVHAVWNKYITERSIIQTASSTDYGVTWQIPASTPAHGGSPNLSDDRRLCNTCQIATNATGEYVYAIWRAKGQNFYIIQTAFSSDYGVTWQYPTTTPSGLGSPNLSDAGKDAFLPRITTNSTGRYVYAIWCRDSDRMIVVQTAFSSDFGLTWQYPTATTGDGGSPNLSDNNRSAYNCNIHANPTGQYVYAIWTRSDGLHLIIQTVKSSDYGVTWQKPTSTPSNGGSPNLSNYGRPALYPHLQCDLTGQFVNVIWQQRRDFGTVIQTLRSIDYGTTWVDPTSTTGNGGSPDLSNDSSYSGFAHMSLGLIGDVFVTWFLRDTQETQIAASSDYGATWINRTALNYEANKNVALPNGPRIRTAISKKYAYVVRFNPLVIELNPNAVVLVDGIYIQDNYTSSSKTDLLKRQYVNCIYWNSVVGAQLYRVYRGSMSNLIYEGTDLQYFDQHMFLKDEKTYLITWLDSISVESNPSQIIIP